MKQDAFERCRGHLPIARMDPMLGGWVTQCPACKAIGRGKTSHDAHVDLKHKSEHPLTEDQEAILADLDKSLT